jgi:DNA-binding MarR family transcriptional regulator
VTTLDPPWYAGSARWRNGATSRARRAGQLAEVDPCTLERTTLTRSTTRLERQGWIETLESDDGRERPLALTAAGRRALEAALPAWKEALDRLDDARPRSPVAAPPNHGGAA